MPRLTLLSDTHGHHQQLAPLTGGDLLIHAGDGLSARHGPEALLRFLARQPYRQVLYVPGNHDHPFMDRPQDMQQLALDIGEGRLQILTGTGTIACGLNIWGFPWTRSGPRAAFSADEDTIMERAAEIPDDTHVLISHGPPYGLLDQPGCGPHIGSAALAARLPELPDLRVHIFGHCHEHGGSLHTGAHLSVNAAQWDGPRQTLRAPLHLSLP